jgi:hypothetical protein
MLTYADVCLPKRYITIHQSLEQLAHKADREERDSTPPELIAFAYGAVLNLLALLVQKVHILTQKVLLGACDVGAARRVSRLLFRHRSAMGRSGLSAVVKY